MITVFYTHDIAADALQLLIYIGSDEVASVALELVDGDRPHYWTGEVPALASSAVYYRIDETIGSETRPAADGYSRSFVDGKTVTIGNTTADFTALQAHGDANWKPDGTAEAAGIAQYLATYLSAGRRLQFEGPAVIGQQLEPPLVRGASYLAAHGRALRFSRVTAAEIPADTVPVLRAIGHGPTPRQIVMTGEIIEANAATKVIQFEPTSQQSALWIPGSYQFQIDLVFPAEAGQPVQTAPFIGPGFTLTVLQSVPSP